MVHTRAFLAQVDWLVETVERGRPSVGAEQVLTAGYARALQLERELKRLEREMTQLAQQADEARAARRLRRLAPRARATRDSLDELRERLAQLKAVLAAQSV
jgi:tRNA C32,U32 (ribose-2'-O)-methylase TrmJ